MTVMNGDDPALPDEGSTPIESVAEVAETLDNLLGAMALPMPTQFHLDQLKRHLPEMRDKLRAAYVAQTGENPWSRP